ncbi:MAG: T9SS type A sorting domain-containing protein [Chitinophagales bacterium]
MKKTTTLLLLLLTFGFIKAQYLSVTPNDSVTVSTNVADEFDLAEAHIHIINNLKGDVTYTWKMVNYVAPPAWELKLCDNNNCYDLILNNQLRESLVVPAGDSMDMKFQFSPHCVAGMASVNVVVFVSGDSVNSATIINYRADLTTSCINAIGKVENTNIKLYPNPVKSSFTVSGLENTGNLSFEVYDIKGSVVKSEIVSTTNNGIEISIAHVAAGDYLLKAFDSLGVVIATAKLQKVD